MKLIKTNHCTKAIITKQHNQISPALVLCFDNHRPMPIRQEKWMTYFLLLEEHNVKITEQD